MKLFRRKDKKKEPAAANPYAQNMPAPDDPYAVKSTPLPAGHANTGPQGNQYPSPSGNHGNAPQNHGNGPQNGPQKHLQKPQPQGYGAGTYAQTGGYNQGQYGAPAGQRPGGYGGFQEDANEQLFAGRNQQADGKAPLNDNRYAVEARFQPPPQQQQHQQPGGPGQNRYAPSSYSGSTAVNSDSGGPNPSGKPATAPTPANQANPYGGYGEQHALTDEELQAQEYQGTKQEIIDTLNESVSSTQRSLQLAYHALETGAATLDELNQQKEILNSTERDLDKAKLYNKIADQRARELKRLNKSMFAVAFSGGDKANQRIAAKNEELMQEEMDDQQAAKVHHDAYNREIQTTLRNNKASAAAGAPRSNKFDYDFDDEDEEFQTNANALDSQTQENVHQLAAVASQLKIIAQAQGKSIGSQITQAQNIIDKNDSVEAHVRLNTNRLQNIR